MKNNFTKIFTGIFLAVFVTVFGVSSVFADSNSTAGGQTNAAPATETVQDLCRGQCTGPDFSIDVSVASSMWSAFTRLASSPFRGYGGILRLITGESVESASRSITGNGGVFTPEDQMPKPEWCRPGRDGRAGEYVPVTKIEEDTVLDGSTRRISLHYRCRGDFDETAYAIESLKNLDSIFLKPLGAIIWVIAKFFEMIAQFLTTLVGFALLHAFSFFSNPAIKDFIFNLWYSFATLVFSLYLVIVAISAFQLMLGIDQDHMAIKKLLPRIFQSVIITGFSFVFFLVCLDLGNIFTKVIYGVTSGGGIEIENIASTLSRSMVPHGIENIAQGIKALPSSVMILLSQGTVVFFTGLLLLSFLSLSFVMIMRTVILITAAILGPFAGLAYAIPGAESYTGTWAKTVAHHALLPAILAFFLGLAYQGAEKITIFFRTTGLDQSLFSSADFADGGIKLSNLLVVVWIGTCIYFGSTRAIKTEYTEGAINLAKGVGEKVKGFFQPALSKTAIFAGVGGAATGAFGGTAAAVTWGAAGYKGLGFGYNATEQKIMEIGKKRLTGYSKDALDKTPLANKAVKWLKASEEIYEKKEAKKDDKRKMATSTMAAEILKAQASRASNDEDRKKLENMADSHLMKIRNEDTQETYKSRESLTPFDWKQLLKTDIDLKDILSKKTPEEIVTAMNEDAGTIRAAYKALSDAGQLNDWKLAQNLTDDEWKRIEAHTFLSPSQAVKFDNLSSEGKTTDSEYIALDDAIISATSSYTLKDSDALKKYGDYALARELTNKGTDIGNDDGVTGILIEKLNKAPESLTHQDRATIMAISSKLKDISAKNTPKVLQELLEALNNKDKLDLIIRAKNGYKLDGALDPKRERESTGQRKSEVQGLHVVSGGKDMLTRKDDSGEVMMTVEQLLGGKFDDKNVFVVTKPKITDTAELDKFLSIAVDQFKRVKPTDIGQVKETTLRAFGKVFEMYSEEIAKNEKWVDSFKSIKDKVDSPTYTGGDEQRWEIINMANKILDVKKKADEATAEAEKMGKEAAEKLAKVEAEKAPKDSEAEKRKKILDSIVIPDKLEMES